MSDIPRKKIDRSTILKCVRGYGVGRNFQNMASITSFHRGVKINAEYYKTEILERILLSEAQKLLETSIIASNKTGRHHAQQTSFRGGAKII
jgi:hypothetical protein